MICAGPNADDVERLFREVENVIVRSGGSSAYIEGKMSTVAPFDPEGETSEATSIKYIAATSSDARIVGMHLLGDEGVTHAVWEEFEDGEDDQEPDEEEDAVIQTWRKPKKAVTVHIANVLRDDRVKFLRDLPQLQSFCSRGSVLRFMHARPCHRRRSCARGGRRKDGRG